MNRRHILQLITTTLCFPLNRLFGEKTPHRYTIGADSGEGKDRHCSLQVPPEFPNLAHLPWRYIGSSPVVSNKQDRPHIIGNRRKFSRHLIIPCDKQDGHTVLVLDAFTPTKVWGKIKFGQNKYLTDYDDFPPSKIIASVHIMDWEHQEHAHDHHPASSVCSVCSVCASSQSASPDTRARHWRLV